MRNGILTAGNFIVDYVKVIDGYPPENMLATILGQTRSNGGGPYNIAKNLAAMNVGYPLSAAALLGDDPDGRWILDDCQAHGIDVSLLEFTAERPTSFTDVMSDRTTGRRTFFHHRGANSLFDGSHIDFQNSNAKIFYLGYLLLLEKLDTFTSEGKTAAADLLSRASAAGLITAVDLVSTEHPEFREIALSALPETDYLVLNEIEASRILDHSIDPASAADLQQAAVALTKLGVRRAAIIHTEYGAAFAETNGRISFQPSVNLPPDFIRGANGAGDAFTAGFLHGIHEQWPVAKSLELAVCAAAACLSDPTPSNGLGTVERCLEIGRNFGYRNF